jgi:cell division protein FtsW (lipid II flippase)
MENSLNKFQQAAISYVGLGVVIVLMTTFFIPSSHYRSGFIPLLIGIVVLLVISYFLSKGVKWLAEKIDKAQGPRV